MVGFLPKSLNTIDVQAKHSPCLLNGTGYGCWHTPCLRATTQLRRRISPGRVSIQERCGYYVAAYYVAAYAKNSFKKT